MAKLYSADLGINNDLVGKVSDDKIDALNLSLSIKDFIETSKNNSGNGKILDGEIWDIIRNRFEQCNNANMVRKNKAEELSNSISTSTSILKQYMASAPEPLDPSDSDKIPYFDACLTHAKKMHDYYSSHKTKLVGYRYDIWSKEYYPIYDFDYEKIGYWARQIKRFEAILKWLKELTPTDSLATSLVVNVDLEKMIVNTN